MNADLALAFELADEADRISMRHVAEAGGPIAFESKADGSPVTAADDEIERRLRDVVARHRATDGFLGEEVGATGDQAQRWIVDGIDGTASFVRGGRSWGTLVACERDGEVVAGVLSAPAVGRRWWASRGDGAWADGERLQVAPAPERLGDATAIVLPSLAENRGWRAVVAARVADRCAHEPRPRGHGPLLVASGDAHLSVHLWGGAWDHATFVVLVEEAGGRFADLWGGRRLDTFTAVFGSRELVPRLVDAVADLAPVDGRFEDGDDVGSEPADGLATDLHGRHQE